MYERAQGPCHQLLNYEEPRGPQAPAVQVHYVGVGQAGQQLELPGERLLQAKSMCIW
jgi:hypothetical protein